MKKMSMLPLLTIFTVLTLSAVPINQIAFADEDEIEIEIEIDDEFAEIKVEIDDDKFEFELGTTDLDEIITIIEVRTGLSREQIEQVMEVEIEGDEVEDDVEPHTTGISELKIRAETLGDQSEVKVELEFNSDNTEIDSIIDEIIEEFSVSRERADEALKIEEEDDDELQEKFEVEVEIEDGFAEIEVELRFVLDSTDRDDILDAIVENSQLTSEQIEGVLDLEHDEEIESTESDIFDEFSSEETLTDETNDDSNSELDSLREENQRLREEITMLQERLKNLQEVVIEQIKVILDTLSRLQQ